MLFVGFQIRKFNVPLIWSRKKTQITQQYWSDVFIYVGQVECAIFHFSRFEMMCEKSICKETFWKKQKKEEEEEKYSFMSITTMRSSFTSCLSFTNNFSIIFALFSLSKIHFLSFLLSLPFLFVCQITTVLSFTCYLKRPSNRRQQRWRCVSSSSSSSLEIHQQTWLL